MVRFLVLYPRPIDIAAFERHYNEVHVPLANKLAELRSYKVARGARVVRGGEAYHLISELEWEDMASLQRDFASVAGEATARDVDQLEELCPPFRLGECPSVRAARARLIRVTT